MLQWCRDHTGNVEMGITMFYIILIVLSVTLLCIYYERCCSIFLQWSQINSIIWITHEQLGILYYQVLFQMLNGAEQKMFNPTSFDSN